MKRRHFVRTLAAAPAAPALLAQRRMAAPDEPPPKIDITVPDAVADSAPRFLNQTQFATLEKLGALLMPASSNGPGARDAGVPEFLDFLIGHSALARQSVYTAGLDGLDAQARKQFNKPFASLDDSQADVLLAPLRVRWTIEDPADPVSHFLRVAKSDMRTATLNSREYGEGKRFAGSGLYWYPLD